MGSLLFKQGVDINLMAQIIAYDTDIDEGAYERLRGKAIRDMKRTKRTHLIQGCAGLPEVGVTHGEARTEKRLHQIRKGRRVHEYIATREGVEKLTGNGPVTKGQREAPA